MASYSKILGLAADRGEALEFVQFVDVGHKVKLFYKLIRDWNNTTEFNVVEFANVRAYRHAALYHCGAQLMEVPHETILEVLDSDWLDEIRRNTPRPWNEHWKLHHYLIVSEDLGCFDLAAEGYKTPVSAAGQSPVA